MKKYLATFYEFRPFQGINKEKRCFWIAEYNLNLDLRSFCHHRTGKTELREISKEEYNKLTNKQKHTIIVRETDG